MNNFAHLQFRFLTFLFVGTLFAGILFNPKDRSPNWVPLISNLDPSYVQKIKFSSVSEEFTVERLDNHWKIISPNEMIAEKKLIEQVLTILKEVDCFFGPSNNIGDYGLSEPYLRLSLSESQKIELAIGDKTPLEDGTYVLYKDRICRTKTEISTRIPNTQKAYISKKLIHLSARKVHSVIHRDKSIFSKTDAGWFQIHPFRVSIDNEKFDQWIKEVSESMLLTIESKTDWSFPEEQTITLKYDDKEEIITCSSDTCKTTNGISGNVSLETKQLMEIPTNWFFETTFLTQSHRTQDLISIEILVEGKEPVVLYAENNHPIFEKITMQKFHRKMAPFFATKNLLTLHFSDDTQIQYSFHTIDEVLYFQNQQEDTVIVATLDFIPESPYSK